MTISNLKVVFHKWWKYEFFRFFQKITEKFCFWSKNLLLLHWNIPSMFSSCSGEQNEQFENPFEFLAQLEFEISLKIMLMAIFVKKIEKKKHKSPGRDQKNLFLPNKKHFSLVHDGLRNFLRCGPGSFPKFAF